MYGDPNYTRGEEALPTATGKTGRNFSHRMALCYKEPFLFKHIDCGKKQRSEG